jgi:muramoyltetrapeptide carboxypeptidase
MNRRQFSATLSGLAAGIATLPASGASHAPAYPQKLIKPPRLRQGAMVGLVMPSGVTDDAHIEKCHRQLEALGFRVKPGKNIRAAYGGYAGSVQERLDDLHDMFGDREVSAIWAGRGGSGASALLPGLHYDLIRRNPKILIGYSDITALHLAIYRRAGLVTFHGPVASSTPTDYTVTQMQAVLMNPRPETTIYMSIENQRRADTQPAFAMRTIRSGVAEGRLVGGNLSVLAALIGTPYAAELRNHLLFLEDVSEAPYRVDRMLTQLDQAQGLKNAAGSMLGVFTRGDTPKGDKSLTMDEVINDHFARLPAPSVYGFSFGHIPHQFTIPMGIRARLDTETQTLTLLESAVSD